MNKKSKWEIFDESAFKAGQLNTPATSYDGKTVTNASLKQQAEPVDAQERGKKQPERAESNENCKSD